MKEGNGSPHHNCGSAGSWNLIGVGVYADTEDQASPVIKELVPVKYLEVLTLSLWLLFIVRVRQNYNVEL